jgi:hypothetical protein
LPTGSGTFRSISQDDFRGQGNEQIRLAILFKVLRQVWLIATFIVAVLGFAAAIALGIWASRSGRPNLPDYIEVRDSPGKSFKAALLNWSGGGGISPYCNSSVAVAPLEASQEDLSRVEFVVFEDEDCDNFISNENSPKIEWVSDSDLRIVFSIKRAEISLRSVRLRRLDASRKVAIQFEIRE